MENFQYSIQLSDQDWAEFSAATEECGLLQASLASGDELLSSDIDQGDSSGSRPPGPPPLLEGQPASRGRGWPGFKEEDKAATRSLVSRSWHEPVLALGADQQTPSTSARSEALLSLRSDAAPLGQSLSLLGPVSSRDKMQRLLQGPAPQGPVPSPPGEPPQSSESPGCSTAPQRPPGIPGAPPRSPSRKKRHAAGAKGGGCLSTPGSAPTQQGSLLLAEVRPKEGLGLAGSRGKGLSAGTAEQTAGTGQDELCPESAGAPVQVTRQGTDPDLSTPVPMTEEGTNLLSMTPGAELHTVSTPAQETHPDISMAKSDAALSTPASKLQPDTPLSTPASKLQPDTPLSTPASKSRLDTDLPLLGPMVKQEVDLSTLVPPHLVSKAQSDVGVSTPAPIPQAGPDVVKVEVAPTAKPCLSPVVSPGGHREKPREEPSAGAAGHHSGEPPLGPVQAPKKKKVRFSMAVPSPEEPGSGETSGPPSPATARPSPPRTAVGGRGGPGGWDAMAVGPRSPQPRILKHLPPPSPSASVGHRPRSSFAVTLPEAYEFFFCDTIEEEDEDAEKVAEADQALAEGQWPDMCEFFFQDRRAQRSGHWGAQPPQAEPVPTLPPGDPVPISIPEAYEHFLGEDSSGGMLELAALLQLQATEPPGLVPWGMGPGTPPEPTPDTAEQCSWAVRQAGEPRDPLTSFTFSQDDMCLVFVAFATWAVRTSDLHTPDAWKTVLLASIGTISAIHCFRRQAQGRPSPSRSRSRSPSPSRSPSS
ncbi:PGC-1 and ERR-induced regulator in muscle protein 1 [Phoca vitulina]|uniref:PGC-1 and ERR-induced regulator in muscle protein 1 n=1 Tax=Phoca vitulina TaxID=9720 RepID=UPI0013960AD6|nr:PGC-1 and ERR-induced regulator in muscle protein 1 [Phoca vitulina]